MPNGKIIFPDRYLSALGQVDLAEAERRFTAERGSLEVVQPGALTTEEVTRYAGLRSCAIATKAEKFQKDQLK